MTSLTRDSLEEMFEDIYEEASEVEKFLGTSKGAGEAESTSSDNEETFLNQFHAIVAVQGSERGLADEQLQHFGEAYGKLYAADLEVRQQFMAKHGYEGMPEFRPELSEKQEVALTFGGTAVALTSLGLLAYGMLTTTMPPVFASLGIVASVGAFFKKYWSRLDTPAILHHNHSIQGCQGYQEALDFYEGRDALTQSTIEKLLNEGGNDMGAASSRILNSPKQEVNPLKPPLLSVARGWNMDYKLETIVIEKDWETVKKAVGILREQMEGSATQRLILDPHEDEDFDPYRLRSLQAKYGEESRLAKLLYKTGRKLRTKIMRADSVADGWKTIEFNHLEINYTVRKNSLTIDINHGGKYSPKSEELIERLGALKLGEGPEHVEDTLPDFSPAPGEDHLLNQLSASGGKDMDYKLECLVIKEDWEIVKKAVGILREQMEGSATQRLILDPHEDEDFDHYRLRSLQAKYGEESRLAKLLYKTGRKLRTKIMRADSVADGWKTIEFNHLEINYTVHKNSLTIDINHGGKYTPKAEELVERLGALKETI